MTQRARVTIDYDRHPDLGGVQVAQFEDGPSRMLTCGESAALLVGKRIAAASYNKNDQLVLELEDAPDSRGWPALAAAPEARDEHR
jgi:hypothetical protein